jgi:hypothetical protein
MAIESKMFSFNKKTKKFSSNITDLGVTQFVRLNADSDEQGIIMVSSKNNSISKFSLTKYEHDSNGYMKSWHLTPTYETIRANPKLKDSEVIIFNV